ncbi:MAG: DegV family protein [Clostridiales bacterium]|nr:DegV family protein [Clostridiales bacterium]
MVKIISDSTCDLSPELIARYDIDIVPLHIILGEEDHKDGQISPDDIYRWSDENRLSPKTAAVSMEDALAAFRPYKGKEVIAFTISSHMSSTYNALRMAAEQTDAAHIHVIDAQNLSTGVGLQVIAAAEMAAQGKSAAEIADVIKADRNLVRASFVVDTLAYLHRGGRCSSVAALMGGALKLHPRITVAEGKMSATKKYRGRMDRVIRDYVTDLTDEMKQARKGHVFITHSGCDEETIAAVHAMLEELHQFDEIHVTRAGGVVSSHCGPGTLGVLYIAGN